MLDYPNNYHYSFYIYYYEIVNKILRLLGDYAKNSFKTKMKEITDKFISFEMTIKFDNIG